MKKFLLGLLSVLFILQATPQANVRVFDLPVNTGAPTAGDKVLYQTATNTQLMDVGKIMPVLEINAAARYGIVAGGFDNVLGLMQLQQDLSGYGKLHYRVILPEGDVCFSNNRYGYNIIWVDWIGSGAGTRLRAIYSGSDEKLMRPYWPGETWQANTMAYIGTQVFTTAYKRFNTAYAGDSVIVMQTAADTAIYKPGKRVLIQSFDQIGNGFPPGTRFNEWNIVRANNLGGGKISLQKSLEYTHDTAVWDVPDILNIGQGSGKPRITLLDRAEFIYPLHVGFYNIIFGAPVGGIAGATGTFQPIGNEVIAKDCYYEGHFWPSQTEHLYVDGGGVIADHTFASEFDKVSGTVDIRNFFFNDVVSNGTGIHSVYFYNVTFKESVQLSPQLLTFERCNFRANAYPTIYDGGLEGAPAGTPILLLKIISCTFSRSSTNQSEHAMDIAALRSMIVPAVTGSTIIVPYTSSFIEPNTASKVYTMTKGTTIFKSDGSKIGTVDSIYWDQSRNGGLGAFMISGNWEDFVAGELIRWSPVLNIYDDGNNKVVSQWTPGFAKYGDELIMRANKEAVALKKVIKLNLEDFRVDGSDRGANVGARVTSINVNVTKAYKGTDTHCYLIIADTAYHTIAQFDLITLGERSISRHSMIGFSGADSGDTLSLDKFHRQFRILFLGSSGALSDKRKLKMPNFETSITTY